LPPHTTALPHDHGPVPECRDQALGSAALNLVAIIR
jgi:hypothetical protein